MKPVEPISVINVDGTPVAVESLSDNVRSLVAVYNTWRQEEANQRLELMKTQAALQDLSRQIAVRYQEEQAAKAAETAATDTEDAGDAAVAPPTGDAANDVA